MTYEEAKIHKQKLDAECTKYSAILNTFKANSIGLVSDEIRATSEWKLANSNYDKSFSELRNFNAWFVKTFKKEIQKDRKNRFSNKGSR